MTFALGILTGLLLWFLIGCAAAFIICRLMWR